MNRLALASVALILGAVAACAGATEQDVLSDQVGESTSGGATSGGNSSGDPGTTSGDPGTTSGDPGTTSGDPGTTSGDVTPSCASPEQGDSTEATPIKLESTACGTLNVPLDGEDWVQFDRPAGGKLSIGFTGKVLLTYYDENGQSYDRIDRLPGKAGTYSIQIQYDYRKFPVSGDSPFNEAWSITLTLN